MSKPATSAPSPLGQREADPAPKGMGTRIA
jgi:hypothetical protein